MSLLICKRNVHELRRFTITQNSDRYSHKDVRIECSVLARAKKRIDLIFVRETIPNFNPMLCRNTIVSQAANVINMAELGI